jgi:hypothetical protein
MKNCSRHEEEFRVNALFLFLAHKTEQQPFGECLSLYQEGLIPDSVMTKAEKFFETLHLCSVLTYSVVRELLNPLNAELNPICHLLALLGAHHIFHVSGLRVNL